MVRNNRNCNYNFIIINKSRLGYVFFSNLKGGDAEKMS